MWQSAALGGALSLGGAVPTEFDTSWARLSSTCPPDIAAVIAAMETPLMKVRRAIIFPPLNEPLFALHHPDVLLEARELRLDHLDRGRVLELEGRGVEFLRRDAHDHLGPAEEMDVERLQRLAQMILHAGAAEQAPCRRLHRHRLAGEGLVFHARRPVDRVLEAAWNAPVVFGRHDQDAVGRPDGIRPGHRRGRKPAALLDVEIVDRHPVEGRRVLKRQAGRRELRRHAGERRIVGALAERAADREHFQRIGHGNPLAALRLASPRRRGDPRAPAYLPEYGRAGERRPTRHCWAMPAFSRTALHLAISLTMCRRSSSGVEVCAVAPRLIICLRTSSRASTSRKPAFILSTIGRGVPAGKARPYQLITWNSGKPDSATVGTSGRAG